ncbi:MAG: carbohydrate kinase family protein [Candidatus Coprovivens sp.]
MIKAICLGRVTYDINLVVDKLPSDGSKNEFFEKNGNVGGEAALVSCCFSKWGINTTFAGVLGNDVNGTRIRKIFDKLHIDTRYIEPSFDNDTPMTIVLINKSTQNYTVINISDKYVGLKKCDFDFTPDLIFVDGYDAVQAKNLLERYPKSLSVIDASLVTSSVIDLVKKAKYAVCSREFAESVSGEKIDFQVPSSIIKAYQKLKKKYLNTEIIITLGERGALYCINNQIKITPSLKVKVEDTHGCGPIFRAAIAHTLIGGGDIEKAVKIGCIAGSLAATKVGALDSIPTLEEIKNIYEQNY